MEHDRKRERDEFEALTGQTKQLKFELEETHLQLEQRRADYFNLENELLHWKAHCEKLNTENASARDVIQDLEEKNKKLVDRINQQIMHRVTEYKEKAL